MDDVRFPVDPVHVMLFARAVCDDNPSYSHEVAAAVPPTFTEALQQFIPDYRWRPQPGRVWPDAVDDAGAADATNTVVLHAEQRFTYVRPLCAGEVLTATTRPGNSWQKSSQSRGTLEFREIVTDFLDDKGLLVLSSVAVEVEMSTSA